MQTLEQHGVLSSHDSPKLALQQIPPEQLPLQHCSFLVQFFPLRLHPGVSAEASAPMPSDPSVHLPPPQTSAVP